MDAKKNETSLEPSEARVAAAAAAIERVHYERLDDQVSKIDLDPQGFEDFFASLYYESNRAVAVVSYSYIDDRMRSLFAGALNPSIRGGPKRLFENMGPLGTSSARIELAAGLYWIGPTTYKNLNLLRKIRNEFAHDPHAVSFTGGRVGGLLTSMDRVEQVVIREMSDRLPEEYKPSPRLAFLLRSILTCQRMMAEMATSPIAQRIGLPASAGLSRPLHEAPGQVADLVRSASRTALRFLTPEYIHSEAESV